MPRRLSRWGPSKALHGSEVVLGAEQRRSVGSSRGVRRGARVWLSIDHNEAFLGKDLTLREALATDRLEDFVRQEEARGAEPAKGSDFERALALLITQRRSAFRSVAPKAPSGPARTRRSRFQH